MAATQLPTYLAQRYLGWKATKYQENKAWFRHLANLGQHPRAMAISCCDSRARADPERRRRAALLRVEDLARAYGGQSPSKNPGERRRGAPAVQ